MKPKQTRAKSEKIQHTVKIDEGLYKHTCRHGCVWYSKNENPKTCANKKCRSPYWDKPFIYKKPNCPA